MHQIPLIQPESSWTPPDEYPDLSAAPGIIFDIETKDPYLNEKGPGFVRGDAHVAGVAIATSDYRFSKYYPMRHEEGPNLPVNSTLAWLRDVLGREEQPKYAAHGIYDAEGLHYEGVSVKGKIFDIQIAEPLLCEESLEGYSLEVLAQKYLGVGKDEALLEEAAFAYREGKRDKDWKKKMKGRLYRFPAKFVGPYAEMDCTRTGQVHEKQLPLLEKEDLMKVYDVECRLIPMLLAMRVKGAPFDVEAAVVKSKLWRAREAKLLSEIMSITGRAVDPWTPSEMQWIYDHYSIDVPRTDKGNLSFENDVMENLGFRGDPNKIVDGKKIRKTALDKAAESDYPAVQYAVAYRKLNKMRRDFVDGYQKLTVNGRIHAEFHQLRRDEDGTRSGRFSCVSGDTILETSRGSFRIDEYFPIRGDLIETHENRWKPIIRKIYKGEDWMYRVELLSGESILCTMKHRLLTPGGWLTLRDLVPGNSVVTYEHKFQTSKRSEHNKRSLGGLRPFRRTTYSRRDSYTHEDGRADRPVHRPETFISGKIDSGKSSAILTNKSRNLKPYVGQEWFPAPKLEGSSFGRKRISDDLGGRKTASSAASRVREDVGNSREFSASKTSGPSHRRESIEQRPGQSCLGYEERTPKITSKVGVIASINLVGRMGVWDLEVEGDHSYRANGFLNHNSSHPNLQQVPHRDPEYGPEVRSLFVPEEGMRWGKFDYSQQEPRLTVHYAHLRRMPGALEAWEIYAKNPNADFHQMTADLAGISRSHAKGINLGLAYGMGKAKLSRQLGMSMEEAEPIFEKYHARLPFMKLLAQECEQYAQKRGYIKTILGRRRHFDFWEPDVPYDAAQYFRPLARELALAAYPGMRLKRSQTRKGMNALIQGGAADMTKIAMLVWFERLGEVPYCQVHDEMDIGVADDDHVARLKGAMDNCIEIELGKPLTVPMKAEAEVGDNWGYLH